MARSTASTAPRDAEKRSARAASVLPAFVSTKASEAGGANLYAYADSNPPNNVDPSGLFTISFSPAAFGLGFIENYIISTGFDAATQALDSPTGCVDWGQANEAGLIGGFLGGLGAGVGIGGGVGEEPASACFSGETLVATESGEKPIRDIELGDQVWSKDADGGDLELRPVTRRFVTPDQSLLDLEIVAADGHDEILRATPTHRFWVDGAGWTVAGDLRVGDTFELRSGKHATLARVEREAETSTVYNLEVEGDHTYFVGDEGVWVHNGCRAKNRLAPDPSAGGAHTTFKTDANGNVTGYQEWTPNPQNPSGFDPGRRFDGAGASHTNKSTGVPVPTPHVHDPATPGGVRWPEPWEKPPGY